MFIQDSEQTVEKKSKKNYLICNGKLTQKTLFFKFDSFYLKIA